jgi:hypothetical protein
LCDRATEARLAVPGQNWRDRRVSPRHALVWVRQAGTWCRGQITAWIRPGTRPGWDCQIVPDGDSLPGGPLRGGRYLYDPAAIRQLTVARPLRAAKARAGRGTADASDSA